MRYSLEKTLCSIQGLLLPKAFPENADSKNTSYRETIAQKEYFNI